MSVEDSSVLRLRIQGALLIVVVFVAGVLAGGATERVRSSRGKPPRPFRQAGELPPPFLRLDLTEEQLAEIETVFEQGRPRTESIMRELMPQLRAVNDSIHLRIREILTPEQVEKLDEEFDRRGLFPGGMDRWRRRPFFPDSARGRGMRPFPPDSPPGSRPRSFRP